MKTMNKMEESKGLSKLNDKVDKMKKKLCQKVDLKYREIEQRRNLPKAVIPVFDTDHPEGFIDFEYNMVYDSEHLNIST